MLLQMTDDEPETEEMERNEGKRHPTCEWDLQESDICNLSFEFSWWDGVHVCWRWLVSNSLSHNEEETEECDEETKEIKHLELPPSTLPECL